MEGRELGDGISLGAFGYWVYVCHLRCMSPNKVWVPEWWINQMADWIGIGEYNLAAF